MEYFDQEDFGEDFGYEKNSEDIELRPKDKKLRSKRKFLILVAIILTICLYFCNTGTKHTCSFCEKYRKCLLYYFDSFMPISTGVDSAIIPLGSQETGIPICQDCAKMELGLKYRVGKFKLNPTSRFNAESLLYGFYTTKYRVSIF